MRFQVTEIEFDFDDDIEEDYKGHLISETLEHIWEVDDEEELVDEISDITNWCIKSLNYVPA